MSNFFNVNSFPIIEKEGVILDKENNLIFDFNNSSKEEISEFLKYIIPFINDGKRVAIKRISRTFYNEKLDDACDIASWEFLTHGYKFCQKEEAEIHLTILSKKDIINPKSKILYLNKK